MFSVNDGLMCSAEKLSAVLQLDINVFFIYYINITFFSFIWSLMMSLDVNAAVAFLSTVSFKYDLFF